MWTIGDVNSRKTAAAAGVGETNVTNGTRAVAAKVADANTENYGGSQENAAVQTMPARAQAQTLTLRAKKIHQRCQDGESLLPEAF